MSAKFMPRGRSTALVRRLLPCLAATAALGAAFTTQAQSCDLRLTQDPGTVVIDYNPFAVGASSAPLDVKLENRAEGACDLRLSIADDAGVEAAAWPLGGVGVQFRPRESSGLTVSPVEPGVFDLLLPGHSITEAQFDVAVVVNAVPEAGRHEKDLRLFMRDVDRTELLPAVPVRIALVSAPRAQVNLAGAAGAFGSESSVEVVDFGEAVTGATRHIFVQLRANSPSTLTISSEHRGVMKRIADDDGVQAAIPYQVALDHAEVDLSALWSTEVDPPRSLEGMSLPMTFSLGEVGVQMSGQYKDVLTINVSPH